MVVVMHDFSVDRIIKLESKTQLIDSLCEKANAGGGIVREGVTTTDVKGGNAVNLAYSLAKLGVNITLFTVAGSDQRKVRRTRKLPYLNIWISDLEDGSEGLFNNTW